MGYRLRLSLYLRSITWSPPCWGASTAAALSFSFSCSAFFALSALPSALGVAGGLGVPAREGHGLRLERKPCLLSGAAILSTGGASPPTRSLLSQDFVLYREAWKGGASGLGRGDRQSTRRWTRRGNVLAMETGSEGNGGQRHVIQSSGGGRCQKHGVAWARWCLACASDSRAAAWPERLVTSLANARGSRLLSHSRRASTTSPHRHPSTPWLFAPSTI